MKSRRVRVSIKTKLIFFFVILIVLSLGAYLAFALREFERDKTAYIYDSNLVNIESLGQEVESYFRNVVEKSIIASSLATRDPFLAQQSLRLDQSLLHLRVKRNDLEDFVFANESLKKTYRVAGSFDYKARQEVLSNVSPEGDLFILQHYFKDSGQNWGYHLHLVINSLVESFQRSKDVQFYMIDETGKVLIHSSPALLALRGSLHQNKFIQKILQNKSESGGGEFEKETGKKVLVSYKRLPFLKAILISEVDKSKAFQLVETLTQKSLIFAILLVCVAIFMAVILARSLTGPILKLVRGTQKIAEGDFKTSIKVSSNDEIGILSDSFNFMSREILRYMSEVQEKARMENELAVAQLVQSSFFPNRDLATPGVGVAGYYTPASECGGDWWGHLEVEGKLLVFIGDATGHGVPAALITATANTAMNLMKYMAEKEPGLAEDPAKILGLLNHVIHEVGGKILMTFFLVSLDTKTGKLIYANASHNPPFLYRHTGGEVSKSNLDVLLGDSGPRLGHRKEANFKNEETTVKNGDALLLFTDGIIEGVNPKGQAYGERRFGKVFLESVGGKPREIIKNIILSANGFYEGIPVDDDLTMVVLKVGE